MLSTQFSLSIAIYLSLIAFEIHKRVLLKNKGTNAVKTKIKLK